ncbi:uracil-DNA glycosylase [Bryobacter aggregatus]|uniref:uracil-DNA glycosylase n=1 Tax=Bryobacter aggregatus TaxID=360054 RepID=UPI00068DA031|nr:uracil-DNA glycosylase [Bryobacter aggregatus]
MNAEQLRQYLEYFRDLGITHITAPDASQLAAISAAPPVPEAVRPAAAPVAPIATPPPIVAAPVPMKTPVNDLVLPTLAPEGDTLARIREEIGDCKRCRLCEARKSIVFGSGNEKARLVFVGEGPGADEDAQGVPFVGRAGQLLTAMIDGTAAKDSLPLRREDCYICNVVKCRPPDNRTPLPDEMEICGQFLYRQLMTLQPKAICALGSTAARALLNTKEGVTKMRGRWQRWNGIPLMVTYHPSYLLRAYNVEAKKEAWTDLRKLFHFVLDDSKVHPE